MKSILYSFIILSFCLACKAPSLESVGGTRISIEGKENIKEQTAHTIINRLKPFSTYPDAIQYTIENNILTIEGVGIEDKQSIKEIISRDRMMKVVYAVSPSNYQNIRTYLGDLIEDAAAEKPYKASSMIGLVSEENQKEVEAILESEAFKTQFPAAGQYNYGVKSVNDKKALFIQDSGSPYMDQVMFEKIIGYEDKEKGEGALSLQLKEEYADRIGRLTGNDSTYLLHLFHDEVYISKIINPHITSPSFGMAGAFTPRDVLVHAALWNSKDLDQEIALKTVETVK